MFNIFAKKTQGDELTLKIEGMHCSNCAMNIDDALEETEGVYRSETSFAKSLVKISYEPSKVTQHQLVKVIEEQGYKVV